MANRDKHKGAYDIYDVLKHDERAPEVLGKMLAAFADQVPVADAIGVLDRDFQKRGWTRARRRLSLWPSLS